VDPEDLYTLVTLAGLSGDGEVTLEVNPDDVTPERMSAWKSAGINRISLGVQTMNEEELVLVRRRHRAEESRRAMKLASDRFANWSVDLIAGFPGQSWDSLMTTLREIVLYAPPHLSLYALEFDSDNPLTVDPDHQASLLRRAWEWLGNQGYRHYEVSNFCRGQARCLHNLTYWRRGEYLGFGAAAHSFFRGVRRWNLYPVDRYLDALSRDEDPVEGMEVIDPRQSLWERIMLGLRLDEGIPDTWLSAGTLDAWLTQGYCDLIRNRVCMQEAGWMVLSELLASAEEDDRWTTSAGRGESGRSSETQ